MSAMLASDLNNPAFVGPVNPDSLLAVEFYWHEPELVHESEEAGKLIRGPKAQYVRIQAGGDHTSIMECPVREEHKRRWPDRWLYWQIQEGLLNDTGADVPGWKLDEWTRLSPEQLRDLKYHRFSVVEQLAGASDAQVQRLGMGGLGLREEARQALRARMGVETKQALEAKDAEIATLKAAQAASEERMAKIEQMLAAQAQNTLHAKRG